MENQKYFMLYKEYFLKGYQDYNNSKEYLEETVDLSKLSTIAYKNGYEFAANCEITHRTLGMTDENFNANLNIYYHRAIDIQSEYHDLYVKYADGFFHGWEDVNIKIRKNDENYNVIPDMNEDDPYSKGYFDGYSFYLNNYLNQGDTVEELLSSEKDELEPEIMVRENFQRQYPSVITNFEKVR